MIFKSKKKKKLNELRKSVSFDNAYWERLELYKSIDGASCSWHIRKALDDYFAKMDKKLKLEDKRSA